MSDDLYLKEMPYYNGSEQYHTFMGKKVTDGILLLPGEY